METKRDKKRAMAQLGIKKLVNYQIAPINSILDENDTFVIAPPSAYRSEIFQIPALMFPGLTLVIEPTVTLLYERVGKLQLYDVRADYIDSSRTNEENVNILRKAQKGKLELLFVTPERLQNQRFQREIEDVFISLVVVDEAHCVTSWGYGFQSAFLKIGEFIDSLPDSPTKIALTAAALPQEREDICELLFMKQANVFINSLYRSNLHFVKYVCNTDLEKIDRMRHLLNGRDYQSCVVYCNTVNMTDRVYKTLNELFPEKVVEHHSKMDSAERKENDLLFLNGERRIMVATSSSYLGLNSSDVDLVIHFDLPRSPMDYYQQAGRAGQLGQASKCVLLYNENDYIMNRAIISKTDNVAVRERMLVALDQMKEYANSSTCLAQQLLSVLGETLDTPCGKCINCQKGRVKVPI